MKVTTAPTTDASAAMNSLRRSSSRWSLKVSPSCCSVVNVPYRSPAAARRWMEAAGAQWSCRQGVFPSRSSRSISLGISEVARCNSRTYLPRVRDTSTMREGPNTSKRHHHYEEHLEYSYAKEVHGVSPPSRHVSQLSIAGGGSSSAPISRSKSLDRHIGRPITLRWQPSTDAAGENTLS